MKTQNVWSNKKKTIGLVTGLYCRVCTSSHDLLCIIFLCVFLFVCGACLVFVFVCLQTGCCRIDRFNIIFNIKSNRVHKEIDRFYSCDKGGGEGGGSIHMRKYLIKLLTRTKQMGVKQTKQLQMLYENKHKSTKCIQGGWVFGCMGVQLCSCRKLR